jgi:hypothetical protein
MNEQVHVPATETLADESPTGAPPIAGAAAAPSPGERRLQRVVEFQARALDEPDPLRANIGVLNSGMMHMAHLMEPMIIKLLADGSTTDASLATVSKALASHQKLLGNIYCFAQLEVRLAELQQAARKKLDRGPLSLHTELQGLLNR